MRFRQLFTFLFVFLFPVSAALASHLMGGSMSYEFLGKSGGQYMYRIYIEMYRDCNNRNDQGGITPFDPSIPIGIYNNNPSKSLYTTEYFSITSEISVDPPKAGNTCLYDPNVCIRKGVYEKIIYLPASTYGYHLLHQRCCRNHLNNILYDQGQSYYVFIPPTSVVNSSPYFTGIPTPYLCSNDSIQISYAATDPDDDSLVYNFVVPWGGGSATNPTPTPNSYLNLPLSDVNYAGAYNITKPFGTGGMALIDHQTGLVTVLSPSSGPYAIAVECREYRNGVLLSTVRRDIELIILNCPPNKAPVLSIPGNKTEYEIETGDTLKFNISYYDPDGDTMDLVRIGDLFGGGVVPATYATLGQGMAVASISFPFNWATGCNHVSKNPYFFTVNVSDRGCPVKTRTNIFKVTVKPFKGPDSISGPRQVCAYDIGVKYQVYGLSPGTKYSWYIQGGTIISRTDTPVVTVNWGKSGTGRLQVNENSKFGCGIMAVSYIVNILPLPIADAGPDKVMCSRDIVRIGNVLADTTLHYSWSPHDYLSDTAVWAPLFTYRNVGTVPVIKKYRLKVVNANNCINYDSVQITINPQYDTFAITGNKTPCLNGLFPYKAPAHPGSTYQWFISGGSEISGGNSNSVILQWTDSLKGLARVVETNMYGCSGDTSHLWVRVIAPKIKILGPPVVCPNSVEIDYWVKYTQGSVYNWHVNNGTMVTPNMGSAIQINWGDSGTAMIWTQETTKEGCLSDTAFFPIIISYHLKTSEIFGDTFVCEFTKNEPYYVINSNGSKYYWSLIGADAFRNNLKNKIYTDWGVYGSGRLAVLEMSYDSVHNKVCIGDTVYQPVIINQVPTTSPIKGPIELCEKSFAAYNVKGFATSTFHWEIDPPISFSGQGSSGITVFWDTAGNYHISVVELSKDSCTGPLIDTTIIIHPNPVTKKIIGDTIICYPNVNSIPYRVDGFFNSTFYWQLVGGNINSGANSSSISVNWNVLWYGMISVKEITVFGCEGPTVTQPVKIDSLGTEMELVTTLPNDEKAIQASWMIINDAYFNKKASLFKSSTKDQTWTKIDSFSKIILNYTDTAVSTGLYSYNYKTRVKDLCGNYFESPPHHSILLEGAKDGEFDVGIHWNNYINWKEGVNRYDIYRKVNKANQYELYRDAKLDTSIAMTIGTEGWKQCFRIVAVKNGNEKMQSWSNEICFKYPPMLFVPNSFSPNNDGINDTFTVVTANLSEFSMIVFDRWGEIIFRSEDPKSGWDGKYKGILCESGVYGLGIVYRGNSPQKTYVGTITLLR